MEGLTIRVFDYVLDDDDERALEAPRNRPNRSMAFFSRPRPDDDDDAAVTSHAYREEAGGGHLFGVPASSKAAAGLRAAAVGETREQGCAVCLEDFERGDELRAMPCSHSFHERCIFRWLQVSCVCPYCRFPLPSADEQHLLDERAARDHAQEAGSMQLADHD